MLKKEFIDWSRDIRAFVKNLGKVPKTKEAAKYWFLNNVAVIAMIVFLTATFLLILRR